jgi:hypothetical protein
MVRDVGVEVRLLARSEGVARMGRCCDLKSSVSKQTRLPTEGESSEEYDELVLPQICSHPPCWGRLPLIEGSDVCTR